MNAIVVRKWKMYTNCLSETRPQKMSLERLLRCIAKYRATNSYIQI
jgi:hypothetical protein